VVLAAVDGKGVEFHDVNLRWQSQQRVPHCTVYGQECSDSHGWLHSPTYLVKRYVAIAMPSFVR
jgi:hypothetical protein